LAGTVQKKDVAKSIKNEGGAISVKNALIVDDSRVARLALARRLGARGIEVVSVASGADALRKLQETHPDVIFMDYMMPEMDGLEACRAIVNNPATASVPVIMTTSNDTPEFRKRGVASGASGFLSKGLEDRELDNVLDSVTGLNLDQSVGGTMEAQAAKLDDETLAWIRDQAINAARKASEEYFTSQLPGLEEQVVTVAENAARKVAGGVGGDQGGGQAASLDMQQLEGQLGSMLSEPKMRQVISQIVREESGGATKAPAAPAAASVAAMPAPRKGGGFGRFIKLLFSLIVLLVIAYFVLTMFFAHLPITAMVEGWVSMVMAKIQSMSG